jgi:sugar/nucleoside kinase (ribokinase family)
MADVGCAGILVADTFCGPMSELPREGQLLAVEDMPSRAGGCAANVAIDLAKQGVSVDVVGCVGCDAAAGIIEAELREHNVGCDAIVALPHYPTSKTVILLVEGQDRRYIHTFGANAAFTVGHIRRDWVARLRVFYLGGLFLMPAFRTQELLGLLQFCREQGVVTVVDVVIPQQVEGMAELLPLLPFIDYFLPNTDEACALTGEREPVDQVRAFLAAGARTVIVTCGVDGCIAATENECLRAGAFPMPVVDPSGPGDAFDAGLIAGLLRGWELPDVVTYASALGASAVRAVGTTPGVFTAQEAGAFLAAHRLDIRRERV